MSRDRRAAIRWGVVLGLAALLALGIFLHVPGLNGPWYWDWPWRRLDAAQLVPGMLAAAIPFAAAQFYFSAGKLGIRSALILLALTTFLLELVSIGNQGPGFDVRRIVLVVQSPVITSYFTDAVQFGDVAEGLGDYPDRMAGFHLHSINKPPGPILYYVAFSRMFGPGWGAMLGGLMLGVLAAAAVAATYGLARRFGASREAGFAAASYFALCPGLVLFFPEFDQAYPLLCCGLLGSWSLALERGGVGPALAFGACLWLLSFMSFGLLVLGVLCLALAGLEIRRSGAAGLRRVAVSAALGLAVVVGAYVLLWAAAGYDPLATFHSAMANQAEKAMTLGRPWPWTIPFDLLDFALGTGWLSFVLTGFWLARRWGLRPWADVDWRVAACLFQVLLVAVAGLIPAETARVWLFMVPLLMLPVGLELAEWTPRARWSIYAALWGLMVLVGQNMVFLGA